MIFTQKYAIKKKIQESDKTFPLAYNAECFANQYLKDERAGQF